MKVAYYYGAQHPHLNEPAHRIIFVRTTGALCGCEDGDEPAYHVMGFGSGSLAIPRGLKSVKKPTSWVRLYRAYGWRIRRFRSIRAQFHWALRPARKPKRK